nr:sulfotransferase 1C2-like [Dermacentor andersoni]
MDSDCYVNVDGVRIPKIFGEENFRSAAKYIPRDGDLFVVSHPKCGTSWVGYGNYFDHLLPWYDIREKHNVLFITYEQLKADTKGQILRIADFIGSDHGAILREDTNTIKKVLDSCSMQNMRILHNDDPEERIIKFSGMFKNTSTTRDEYSYVTPPESRHEGSGFVRKGAVGDWRNHFTAKQIEITKAWIADKCKNSTVMQLWADLDLP